MIPVETADPGILRDWPDLTCTAARATAHCWFGLGHLPPDGDEEVILLAPIMVDPVKVFIEVGQNAIRDRLAKEIVVSARSGGCGQIFHPLQCQRALLRGWNLVPGIRRAMDHAVRNGLCLWIVDRDAQVGEVTGAFLQRGDGEPGAGGAAQSCARTPYREEVSLVLGSPDERQDLRSFTGRPPIKPPYSFSLSLGRWSPAAALIGELQRVEVSVAEIFKYRRRGTGRSRSGGDDNFAAGGGAIFGLIARGQQAHFADHVRRGRESQRTKPCRSATWCLPAC